MYQIFLKDMCTNRNGIHRIEIDEDTTIDEFKKMVFIKTKVPSLSQKFLSNSKYLNHGDNILKQLDFQGENWITLELMFRWHGPNCFCSNCGGVILLRNGKRVNRI